MLEQEISKLANQALLFFESNRLVEARALYKEICQLDEENVEAWRKLVAINRMLGDAAQMEVCCKRITTLQPNAADAHFELGIALEAQHKPDQAITSYRQALKLKPDYIEVYTNLGILLQRLGQHEDALQNYRQALHLNSNLPIIQFNLGVLYQERDQLDAAENSYRNAIKIKPDYARAHANLGYVLRLQEKLDEAIACYRRALELDAGSAAIHYNLGLILKQLGRLDEAEASQLAALHIAPDYADAHVALGCIFQAQGKGEEAIRQHKCALQFMPDCVDAYLGQAVSFSSIGNQEETAACCRQALQLDPNHIGALTCLGGALLALNKPDEAKAVSEHALAIDPASVEAIGLAANIASFMGDPDQAYKLLAPLVEAEHCDLNIALAFGGISKDLGRQSDAIGILERFLNGDRYLPPAARRKLHFSIGNLLDGIGEYDTAFTHFEQGNALKKATFNPVKHVSTIDVILAAYNSDFMAQAPRASNRSERPIFIVGMPRSGTSLVEQIIASHPAVFGAGELSDIVQIPALMHNFIGTNKGYPYCLPLLTQELLDRLAQKYLDHLNNLSANAVRISDKMPGNFMNLGLIELLLPKARVIHCVRDPLDTCLSCYFQDFAIDHPYLYDLQNLGVYYKQYQRIMQHWRKTLTIPMMDVRYEELVGNQESVSRALVKFCGLDWDDRCLSFHKTKRFVGTASFNQVYSPIYDKSVSRWKHYARHIGPLRDALK